MKCTVCGKEMMSGMIQSDREVMRIEENEKISGLFRL